MSETPSSASDPPSTARMTLVWEWPLRIWHWLFALCVAASLYTGLVGDIGLMDWHLVLGYCALGLVLFRLLWAIWGGAHARLTSYATSPRSMLAYFRGDFPAAAHTPPGAALAVTLVLLVALQVLAGLFTTDEIFSEGPLVPHAPDALVAFMSAAHHRIFWLILVFLGVHLGAHAVYGMRRDPTPLSMFTGRKAVEVSPTEQRWVAGLLTAAAVGAAVVLSLRLV